MRRQKWLATFGSRARAMRPGLFLPEATPVKHSPAGTLTLVPAYPPRNRPASTWRKPSRQRNVDETWPGTARGNRIPTTLPRSTNVSHWPVRSFISIAIVPRSPFLVLLPTYPLFLLNSTFYFSAQAPFFLVPFAEGPIRCGDFPALNLPSENRLSAFSHAVVFSREADF